VDVRARQGRLSRGHGILGPSHHVRDLVPAAQLWIPVAGAAGTDAFPNFASLRGPPGLVRVFVHSGVKLDHRSWLAALKTGRTFVTNAPLLEFSVAGRAIGEEIRVSSEMQQVPAVVAMRSTVPIDTWKSLEMGRSSRLSRSTQTG